MIGAILMLVSLGALGGSAILSKRDDISIKKLTREVDEKGNVWCMGRKGEDYVNGEKVISAVKFDEYGNTHDLKVGKNSGKVYYDSYDIRQRKFAEDDERERQLSLSQGYTAYRKWNPQFRKPVTTEMSTGKVIACLYKYGDVCRKFYVKPNAAYYEYNKLQAGDHGIPITEDEYKKLNIRYGSHSNVPGLDIMHEVEAEYRMKEREKCYKYYLLENQQLNCKGNVGDFVRYDKPKEINGHLVYGEVYCYMKQNEYDIRDYKLLEG